MPVYEYICEECGEESEKFTTFENMNKKFKCHGCGNILKRVEISKNSFILMGNGWTLKGNAT
jgi:putative FmdB family regulatory protein